MENKEIQSEIARDEQISRYMKGQMSAQEETEFMTEMESNAQLREEAIIQARLVRGMQQVDNDLIKALKNVSASDLKSAISVRKSRFKRPVVWISMVASIAILLVVGYKGYDYYHTTRLGMKYATVFPMETIIRGELDINVESELLSLFDNVIERRNLDTTTDRLSELWEISNQDTYNDYTEYAPYIGWYLAIGYLEDYEKEKSVSVLHTLVSLSKTTSSALKTQVNKILNEL